MRVNHWLFTRLYKAGNSTYCKCKEKNVEVRGDEYAMQVIQELNPASDDDWGMEYLDYIISVKTVDSVDEAIEHINTYNTRPFRVNNY